MPRFLNLSCLSFIIFLLHGRVTANENIKLNWHVCRADKVSPDFGLKFDNAKYFETSSMEGCEKAIVPGSILSTLLSNGHFDVSDPFYGDNLRKIPDIETDSAFYTYWCIGTFDNPFNFINHQKYHLNFHGINYRAEIFLNGKQLMEGNETSFTRSGMFRRHQFEISDTVTKTSNILAVLVSPPDFVGSASKGGQGGDHEIARNGALQQYSAGWDWVQATPDRNTGIWDKVELEASGDVHIRDPYTYTRNIDFESGTAETVTVVNIDRYDSVNDGDLAGDVQVTLIDADGNRVDGGILSVNFPRGVDSLTKEVAISLPQAKLWWPHTHGTPHLYTVEVSFTITKPDPRISSTSSPTSSLSPSHSLTYRHGVRTVEAYVDERTRGRAFRVNGAPIFLVGGNWIGTDQLVRYSRGDLSSLRRYHHEVALHRDAGLNIIRVWGGGIAERQQFYDACDELGVLVHQEFWMTGDNNGRWAGSYSWPDDTQSYLDNVRDTILTLRSHPSLLLWCGGNELNPDGKNPNPDVARGIKALLAELDPLRFYVPSSMSTQSIDPASFDVEFALAPTDGPYGILFPSQWYMERNPGLPGFENTPISFQPEVGSVSTPVLRSMRRFLPPESLVPAALPNKLSSKVDPMWDYHKYIPYSTGSYDHIYAYSPTATSSAMGIESLDAEEYCWRAQMVQYEQYRALFEGYILRQWKHYAAVLLWKSQSPWPALRGGLYDYYLDQTGGHWGTRVATDMGTEALGTRGLHGILNPKTLEVSVVNRLPTAATDVDVWVQVTTLEGLVMYDVTTTLPLVDGNAVVTLDEALTWPQGSAPDAVYLFRVHVAKAYKAATAAVEKDGEVRATALPNTYWIGDPAMDGHDYSRLGAARVSLKGTIHATVLSAHRFPVVGLVSARGDPAPVTEQCRRLLGLSVSSSLLRWGGEGEQVFADEVLCGAVELQCPDSSDAALVVRIGLLTNDAKMAANASASNGELGDRRVLPTFYSSNYVTLLPGESAVVVIAAFVPWEPLGDTSTCVDYAVEIEGWNVRRLELPFPHCGTHG